MKIINMLAVLIVLSAVALSPAVVMAEAPYQAYVYNEWDKSKAAPNSYLPEAVYTGVEVGVDAFRDPQDMFVDNRNQIYIADTGNNRIVKLDGQFKLIEIVQQLELNGQPSTLSQPTGIYVDDAGVMYIADKGNSRVVRVQTSNQIDLVIEKPNHPLIPQEFVFKPSKVAADSAGRIYVLSEGQYYGLMQFDIEGAFTSYYGSNKIEVTPAVVLEAFWKSILSREQRESMVKLLPIEYSNLHVGPDDFIFTSTIVSKNSREQIKKLNPLGNNVLKGREGELAFGDREFSMQQGVKIDTSFIDVTVDSVGFIAALDRTRGRVFEYDQEGNPTAIFGAIGDQKGTFLQPSAIDYLNQDILVLDGKKNSISQFRLSKYGSLVREATTLYNQGKYEEAAVIWQTVSMRNSNSSVAHVGIAKALEKEENYSQAMMHFKLGAERTGYSDSYGQIRIQTVRDYLPTIMTIIFFVVLGMYGYKLMRNMTLKRRGTNR